MLVMASTLLTNCTSFNTTMREPSVKVDLTKSDFTLSDQVSAEATSTTVIGIDWERLFLKKSGNVNGTSITGASIPVIGNFLGSGAANLAMYELMTNNPGYDVIIYPQYEVKEIKPLGIGFFTKTTTVKVTSRLGKLNK